MGKFLLGLLTGVILVILVGVIGFFAIASLRSKPATIADGSTLVLHLWGEVPEKPPVEFSIPGITTHNSITVEDVWSMLRRAAADSRVQRRHLRTRRRHRRLGRDAGNPRRSGKLPQVRQAADRVAQIAQTCAITTWPRLLRKSTCRPAMS
jgi:hypothetical protein